MECVVSTTDAELFYAAVTKSYWTIFLDLGSNPVVGSSINNRFDPPIIAIPN